MSARREIRHRTHVRGTGALREILPYYRWGMAAGLLGAFVVALYFLALDLVAGRPFATPNALGSALFLGIPFDPAQPLRPIMIAGYTMAHGVLFLGLALLVSTLVLGARKRPLPVGRLWITLAGSFAAGLVFLFGSLSLLFAPLAGGLQTPATLTANLIAAGAMALLLAIVFQTRWRPESQLSPRVRHVRSLIPRRSRAGAGNLRDHDERHGRLDPEWFHLFSLEQLACRLRSEPEFAANGRNGLVLIKTEQLRVVLEVAAEGTKFAEHTVLGSSMLVVLSGSLRVTCGDETRALRRGEMAVVPHDRPRAMTATGDVSFLWTLSLEPPDAESDARSFVPVDPPRAFGPRGS